MTGPRSVHLGDRLAALVDGQLGHADRDRVLAHLARCADCRCEAAEQRALKARLDHLDVRAPGGLESRLLALPLGQRGPGSVPSAWTAAGRPGADVPAAAPVAGSPPPSSRRWPPVAALGALLLAGVGVAGGVTNGDPVDPPRRDPGLPGLVVEHARATNHVPLPDPAAVGAAWSTTRGAPADGVVVPVDASWTTDPGNWAVPVVPPARGR